MFYDARVFDKDLSSWNVGKVTNMHWSESSVRSLLLLLLVDCNVLSSVSLSPPSLSCGVPLLVPPLFLSHWSPPLLLLVFYQATAFSQTLCGQAWVDSTAQKHEMFFETMGAIGTEYCTACSNTGGTAVNDGTCTCNTAACTPGTGLLCTFSSSSCHSIDLCANTAGTTENTEKCQCGSSICPTGHFCTSAEHKCSRCPVNQEKVDDYCLPTERGDLIEALVDAYGDDVKRVYNSRGQC